MMPPYGSPSYGAIYPGPMYSHPGLPPYGMPYGGAPGANTASEPAPMAPLGNEGKEGAKEERGKGRKRERGGRRKGAVAPGDASEAPKAGLEPAPKADPDEEPSVSDEDEEDDSNGDTTAGGSSDATARKGAMGMPFSPDYWQPGKPSPGQPGGDHKGAGNGQLANVMPSSGMGIPPELWCQDERELKKQRRKQSNRESARRSRLRKQAECEELTTRVQSLGDENGSLKSELAKLQEECARLEAGNVVLQEQLRGVYGESLPQRAAEAVSKPPLATPPLAPHTGGAAAPHLQPAEQLPPRRASWPPQGPAAASSQPAPAAAAAPPEGPEETAAQAAAAAPLVPDPGAGGAIEASRGPSGAPTEMEKLLAAQDSAATAAAAAMDAPLEARAEEELPVKAEGSPARGLDEAEGLLPTGPASQGEADVAGEEALPAMPETPEAVPGGSQSVEGMEGYL